MRRDPHRYVVCVRAEEAGDLELRKLYRVLPDEAAEAEGYRRVVDESGEDYLYPSEWFIPVQVPRSADAVLADCPQPTATRTRRKGRQAAGPAR